MPINFYFFSRSDKIFVLNKVFLKLLKLHDNFSIMKYIVGIAKIGCFTYLIRCTHATIQSDKFIKKFLYIFY